jgi:hypothetical protein
MSSVFEYREVETIRETQYGKWIYRFHESSNGVWVKRTGVDRPTWTHDLLVQIFDIGIGGFRPACVAGLQVLFDSLREAELAISGYLNLEGAVV